MRAALMGALGISFLGRVAWEQGGAAVSRISWSQRGRTDLTQVPSVAGKAKAFERVDAINAGGSVQTGAWVARIGVCKKSRASIRALGRQLHQQENLFPCLFRREYQLFWGDLGELYSITYCHCCCWKNEVKRPNPPYKEDWFCDGWTPLWRYQNKLSEMYPTHSTCCGNSSLSAVSAWCIKCANLCPRLHQLKVDEEECGILISDGNILK